MLFGCVGALPTFAAPVYQSPGSNLTYGDVANSQGIAPATSNPAAAAAAMSRARRADGNARSAFTASAVAGLEYGNFDRFYDRLDELAKSIKPTEPGAGEPGDTEPGDGGPVDPPPGGGIDLGEIVDICCPNLRQIVERIGDEVAGRVLLATLISVEGYAKGFRSVDLPVVTGKRLGEGAWTVGVNWSQTSKAYGIADPASQFDPEAALADLTRQYDLMPGDPVTRYRLVGGVDLTVDPARRHATARFDNDGTMLSKASKTTEFWVGYGRQVGGFAGGELFTGIEAHYYALELSRLAVRYGDISNSKDVFETINDTDFRRADAFGVDIGALWVADRVQIGATLTNLNEPGFDYPAVDTSAYRADDVVRQLIDDQRYVMERQLKLEASIHDSNWRRTLNVGLDTNAIVDPMGDEFQWLTVSGGFDFGNNWFRNLRVGYRRNLAGTELGYIGLGASVLRWFDVDVALELDRVEIDEDEYPRGAMLSLGFHFEF